jgi:alpha-tubulin suppressor-like RCC1 family protein
VVGTHAPAHSCGVTSAGQVWCWGLNGFGRLGDGTDSTRLVPTVVAREARFRAVSLGFYHPCAVTSDGRVLCWGSGAVGHLGNSDTGDQWAPVVTAAPD